jgi:hypothetical protein
MNKAPRAAGALPRQLQPLGAGHHAGRLDLGDVYHRNTNMMPTREMEKHVNIHAQAVAAHLPACAVLLVASVRGAGSRQVQRRA